jgi:hypothetical protein
LIGVSSDFVTINEESVEDDKIDFNGIVEVYLDDAGKFLCNSVIRSMHEFKKNYRPLLISMETFVHHCLTNIDNELLSTFPRRGVQAKNAFGTIERIKTRLAHVSNVFDRWRLFRTRFTTFLSSSSRTYTEHGGKVGKSH